MKKSLLTFVLIFSCFFFLHAQSIAIHSEADAQVSINDVCLDWQTTN